MIFISEGKRKNSDEVLITFEDYFFDDSAQVVFTHRLLFIEQKPPER